MAHAAIIAPQTAPVYAKLISTRLNDMGIDTVSYGWRDIDVKDVLNAVKNPVVIIADAENCPAFLQNEIGEYLKSGGNVVTLGGPPFSNEFYSINNEDIDIFTIKQMMAEGEFDKTVILPLNSAADLEGFAKDTYNPDSKKYDGDAMLSIVDDGAVSPRCVRYFTADFSINESFEKDITIKAGHNAIGFYAKSSQNTRTITVKLIQEDGAMFKLTFCPTTNFCYYIFTKRDFVYAGNRKAEMSAAKPEYVDYSNVKTIQFGHALSHAYSVAGEHCFYLEELSSASIALLNDVKISIDGLYPAYKFHPVTNAVSVATSSKQTLIEQCKLPVPQDLFSHSPRCQGTGIDKGRRARFIPLLECYDEKGIRCGYAAYAILQVSLSNLRSNNETGSIVAFTTADYGFYEHGGADCAAQAVASLYRPAVLIEGGTDEYIYRENQAGTIGAVVLVRDKKADFKVRVSYDNVALIYDIHDLLPVENQNGMDIRRISSPFTPADCVVNVELLMGETVLDRLSHRVEIFQEKPESMRQFAYIKPGCNEVCIGDEPVRFFGVNYMPTANVGMHTHEEFEHYVAAFSYDPDIIEEDFKRICDVGLNSVSVFMHFDPSIHSNNILHLVNLCTKYGLYVDLALRPHADPFDFRESEVREMIERYGFDKNDTIVSYDIAWERYVGTYEPCYGNFLGRKNFDEGWRKFVDNRYGSVATAEKVWGCQAPRNADGEVIGVPDDMLRGNHVGTGELKMICAYRRFIDNTVAIAHHKAAKIIKSIDPNHLISPRTGDASSIPLVDPGVYGYDYKAISSSMDFMSPESYALSDNYKSMRQGVFTNIYARYVNNNNVIQWKEFGKSIWTGSNFSDNSISEEFQAEYYRRFFDMLIVGHTCGLYAWWWAGGYRIGENSDFGIVAPDGSDRPVTRVFREYRERFLNQPMLTHDTNKIEINRDLYADGLLSMYERMEQELFCSIESGNEVEFVDGGSGRTSAEVAITEIGNDIPQGYISMFLDCIITDITAIDSSGLAVSLVNYQSLGVGSTLKITLLNTEKPTWLANGYGAVELVSTNAIQGTYSVPIEYNVPSLGSYTFTVFARQVGELSLRLWAKGRTGFGEVIKLTVIE